MWHLVVDHITNLCKWAERDLKALLNALQFVTSLMCEVKRIWYNSRLASCTEEKICIFLHRIERNREVQTMFPFVPWHQLHGNRIALN